MLYTDIGTTHLCDASRLLPFHAHSEEELPKHPVLSLVALSEQYLSYRYSRLLVTMEKTKPLDTAEEALFEAQHVAPQYV